MAYPQKLITEHPGLGDWCIIHSFRGSIAHGMYMSSKLPNSIDDKDTISICVPTIDHYYGLKEFGSRGTQEIQQMVDGIFWDTVIYESKKALFL